MSSSNYLYWNNKSVKHLFSYFFLTFMAVGCATQPTALPSTDAVQSNESAVNTSANNSGITLLPTPVEVVTLPIVACDNYSKLDTNAQKKQLIETQQALAKNKQDLLHRIRLACVYALPSSYAKDATKAHVLLQQLKDDETLNNTDKAFISHIYMFNNENIKQQQKSRDDARSFESLTQKYEMLEKKYDASEQKLIQLKNIEKKLNVR